MFHRRLLLLLGGMVVASSVMGAQALYLTLVRGEELAARAERRLVRDQWTPTIRGRILDRKGRVLARDEASFDVLVEYPVITGERAFSDAARAARKRDADEWPKLGRAARRQLIEQQLAEHVRHWDQMWDELAQVLGRERSELEVRRTRIRSEVQRAAASIWERWLEERREELNRDRELGEEIEVTLADVRRPLAIQREAHLIERGVSDEVGYAARRLAERYGGIEVQHSGSRSYPLETMTIDVSRLTLPGPLKGEADESGDAGSISVTVRGVARHILGWMRKAQREEFEARPRIDARTGVVDRGHYQEGDRAGARGIEAVNEKDLRGLRGRIVRHLDTGLEEVVDPGPGHDVRLTIDAVLQAKVQAAMDPVVGLARVQPWHFSQLRPRDYEKTLPDGTELYGAAVVLEIDSGDILAMVSTPSFSMQELEETPESVFEDRLRAPWVNKAIAKPYPPGSIVKPIVLVDAVTGGGHSLGRGIECTGHLLPDRPDQFRCWIFKQYNSTHSDSLPESLLTGGRALGGQVALAVSCNVYFQTLAREMDLVGIMAMYRRFGVERTYGLGIGEEYAGVVGAMPPEGRLLLSHAILMGIGQGPVAWTPLHAADAYATLARGGLRLSPRLRLDDRPHAEEIVLDPGATDEALKGLYDSVNAAWGTGHSLRYPDGSEEPIFSDRPGIRVLGKTGTAQAPLLMGGEDPETGERPVLRFGDHSWYLVLVGAEGRAPKFAISVIMEYAGSGGRVSGPICNQIVQALIDEGYLP